MKNCKGDIRELSPTVFAGVPMVYDRIKAGIVAKIQSASFISKIIFHTSLKIKKWYIQRGSFFNLQIIFLKFIYIYLQLFYLQLFYLFTFILFTF